MKLIITHAQSRDARRELGISQADVATALGINRAYLSDFENGHLTRLTKAQLRKLRDLYEAKAEEARAQGDDIELNFDDPAPVPAELPTVEKVTARRLGFMIPDSVPDEAVKAVQAMMAANDERLVDVLVSAAERDEGFFGLGGGGHSEATLKKLREAFALLSANYLMIRALTGWQEIGLLAGSELVQGHEDSVLGVLIELAREQFVESGLIVLATEQEAA